jgi:sarcinarray family protein
MRFRMNIVIIIILMVGIAIIVSSNVAMANANIRAYFNGQEATVDNVTLKVGETFTIDLYFSPDRDSIIDVLLTEPGIEDSYDRIDGESKGGDYIEKICMAGNTTHFHWVLAANYKWAGGTSPVNIVYNIDDYPYYPRHITGEFTVVNAYISSRHYTGNNTIAEASKLAIGPEILPIALLAGFLIARRRLSR